MAFLWRLFLQLCAVSWLLASTALAEPVQYCRFGDAARPNQDADFCVGLTTQRNVSTGAHNVFLTMTHTRRQRSATGWTAVGVGDEMKGSLMFIVYGDPASGEKPIVSIRASEGHSQPTLLTREQMGGGDLKILRSDWLPSPSGKDWVATFSALCYSCTLWPGTTLSATARSQPWIWAWNKGQEFDVYTYDAHLKMHAHHAGKGGWGRFYVDMARADMADEFHIPSVPIIRPGVAALGASDSPNIFSSNGIVSWVTRNPLLHVHGALMSIAFLVLFPAGVFGMRSGSSKAFKHHWIIQALASAFMAGGVATGLVLQRQINLAHQIVGLSIAGALFLQAYLGWKHHVDFVRIKRRTWISYAHIWTGRSIMGAGYVNLMLGLLLRGYSRVAMTLTAVFIAFQSLAMILYVWRQGKRAAVKSRAAKYQTLEAEEAQACFTVASEEDDDNEEYEEDYADDKSSNASLMKEKKDSEVNRG
ncbi:hypothetical protein F4677DRAFT_412337 [Hypoxylon crocopeplum]|nr:hypothetical protein F4677DRAFT_412337 [Hypoxylon crocopeplum]